MPLQVLLVPEDHFTDVALSLALIMPEKSEMKMCTLKRFMSPVFIGHVVNQDGLVVALERANCAF